MSKYADYDDLIRDLDQEGMSDDPFGAGFEDDDLALLNAYSPDAPKKKRAPDKKPPAKKPPAKKPPAKKPARKP